MRPHRLVRCLAVTLVAGSALALAPVSPPSAQAASPAKPALQPQPLERAHAHNDYEHARPLADALDHGFTSVEADVWLVDGELYIGHDGPDLTRTLASTYLEPLSQRFKDNGGSVYRHWDGALRLLIDVKSEGTAAWPVIERELAKYPQLFTTYRGGQVTERAVEAVISGNRDLAAMQAARARRSGYDGRMGDLRGGLPSSLLPLLSDNWTKHFTWQGVGPMPEAERQKLHDIVDAAHAAGYEVRFWATPDQAGPVLGAQREAVWRELVDAEVDVLNTDDLASLEAFLLANDPGEQAHAA